MYMDVYARICVYVSMYMHVCARTCVCLCVCTCIYRSENNLWELVLYFHHVGFGDPTLLPSRGFVLVCFLN